MHFLNVVGHLLPDRKIKRPFVFCPKLIDFFCIFYYWSLKVGGDWCRNKAPSTTFSDNIHVLKNVADILIFFGIKKGYDQQIIIQLICSNRIQIIFSCFTLWSFEEFCGELPVLLYGSSISCNWRHNVSRGYYDQTVCYYALSSSLQDYMELFKKIDKNGFRPQGIFKLV